MQNHCAASVPVESIDVSTQGNGLDLPILHEILHGLQRLQETGETTTIDLRAIPFGPGEVDRLLSVLGKGEIDIQFDALGTSRLWESHYPGVWVIDHRDLDGNSVALQIEVARVPQILYSQSEEIEEAIVRLEQELHAATDETPVPAKAENRSA